VDRQALEHKEYHHISGIYRNLPNAWWPCKLQGSITPHSVTDQPITRINVYIYFAMA